MNHDEELVLPAGQRKMSFPQDVAPTHGERIEEEEGHFHIEAQSR